MWIVAAVLVARAIREQTDCRHEHGQHNGAKPKAMIVGLVDPVSYSA